MKILAFGASNSKTSINKQFATYASNQIEKAEVILLDLNDFEMPIYSIDKEKENGIPDLAKEFKQYIKDCDGIIISFAEHNGAYTAAFKNIFDWISRIEKVIPKILAGKGMNDCTCGMSKRLPNCDGSHKHL